VTRPITNRARRTYFNNPLVEETLKHLPAALEHPASTAFRDYLGQNLHHNSQSTRLKAAEYISARFAKDGAIDLDLARALKRFGDSRIGREILYFEYLQAIPLLQEIAVRWLAALPEAGGNRQSLLAFLGPLLGGRSTDKVAQSAVQTFKLLGRLRSPKLAHYVPIWSEPPLEAFLYILARMFPERSMVQVETFGGENTVRAMLWPVPCLPELLKAAERAGHVSKISQLDQYHQFTLAGTGAERMRLLLGGVEPVPAKASGLKPPQQKVPVRHPSTRLKEEPVAYVVGEAGPAEEGGAPEGKPQNQLDLFGQPAGGKAATKRGKKSHAG
jgi:hypothetical protein